MGQTPSENVSGPKYPVRQSIMGVWVCVCEWDHVSSIYQKHVLVSDPPSVRIWRAVCPCAIALRNVLYAEINYYKCVCINSNNTFQKNNHILTRVWSYCNIHIQIWFFNLCLLMYMIVYLNVKFIFPYTKAISLRPYCKCYHTMAYKLSYFLPWKTSRKGVFIANSVLIYAFQFSSTILAKTIFEF